MSLSVVAVKSKSLTSKRILSALGLISLSLTCLLSGCKSPESAENEASRPWNAPRQWETGLPGFNNYYDRR